MSSFDEDKIKNEKKLQHENASLKFIPIPLVMFGFVLGVGVTYLALRTNNTDFNSGDSRTVQVTSEAKLPDGVNIVPLQERIASGKKVFEVNCEVCHQADGKGVPDSFPPLAGSEWVNGPAERMAAIVLHGIEGEITVRGNKFNDVMPTFNDVLSYDEIADVITYVRQAFGNKSSPITKEHVLEVLKKTENKAKAELPWGGEKELNSIEWNE